MARKRLENLKKGANRSKGTSESQKKEPTLCKSLVNVEQKQTARKELENGFERD